MTSTDPSATRHPIADLQQGRTEVTILVWASSAPRIMTMVPIVRALRQAGFAAYLGLKPGIARKMQTAGLLAGVDHVITSTTRLKTLDALNVFIAAETQINSGPEQAIRVALYHSLPDNELRYNYANMFRRKPQVGALMDYFCTAVQQPPRHWRVAHYRRVIDRIYPPSLLRHRRDTLTLIPLGYPKIDLLIAKADTPVVRDTITYAPTQTILNFSSVREAGAEIIAELLAGFPEHRIAFRPYPGQDVTRLRDIIARFRGDPRFVCDTSLTGDDLMMRSAVVVTDRSSMAMSYSLGLARPSVFFARDGIKGADPQGFKRLDPVGYRAGSVAGVRDAVRRALTKSEPIARRIEETRGNYIHNPGHAADHLAAIMPDILAGRTRDDWLAIPRRPFASTEKVKIDAHIARLADEAGSRTRDKSIRVIAAGFETTTLAQRPVNLARVARRGPSLRRYRSRPTDPGKR